MATQTLSTSAGEQTREAELLAVINAPQDMTRLAELDDLVQKNVEGKLGEEDIQLMNDLINWSESQWNLRLEAVQKLATIRGRDWRELLAESELRPQVPEVRIR